ncbi:MAG TPA: hypothetical protein VFW33_12530 [Gemmataceae bacterium]|nr:hypothetical protein [Gemmataceae bacterium]
MKISWGVLGTCLLVAASGCGSSSSSGVSIATACADVAKARCSLGSDCSLAYQQAGTGFNILENYGTMATCVQRQTMNCTNALNAPDNGNTPNQVENQCVPALISEQCAAFFDNMTPTACTPTGPRPAGAACTFNGQCMSGACNGTKTSVCGTCGSAPAIGEDCSDSTCAEGDRCLGATETCAAIVGLNGTCDATHPCDRGYSCVGEDTKTMTAGTCEAASNSVGTPCGGTMPGCDPTLGLYCGGPAGAKTCQRVIYPGYNGTVTPDGGAIASDGGGADSGGAAPTPAGTLCGQLADGMRVGCVAGGCYTATGLAGGSDLGGCKPFANDDDACDTVLGPGCMAPARCVVSGGGDGGTAGKCTVPVATACPSQ